MLIPRDYWIAKGESVAQTAQNIDHVVSATNDPHLRYIYVASSDGSRVAYQLERPNGTVVFSGYTPDFVDFGMEGFFVPGAVGDTPLRLAISAGAATIVTRGWMMGVDKPRSH